jgi:hypothetical protein
LNGRTAKFLRKYSRRVVKEIMSRRRLSPEGEASVLSKVQGDVKKMWYSTPSVIRSKLRNRIQDEMTEMTRRSLNA